MSAELLAQKTISELFDDYAAANGWEATKAKLSQNRIDFFVGAMLAFVALESTICDDVKKNALAVQKIRADIRKQLTAMLKERETVDN